MAIMQARRSSEVFYERISWYARLVLGSALAALFVAAGIFLMGPQSGVEPAIDRVLAARDSHEMRLSLEELAYLLEDLDQPRFEAFYQTVSGLWGRAMELEQAEISVQDMTAQLRALRAEFASAKPRPITIRLSPMKLESALAFLVVSVVLFGIGAILAVWARLVKPRATGTTRLCLE